MMDRPAKASLSFYAAGILAFYALNRYGTVSSRFGGRGMTDSVLLAAIMVACVSLIFGVVLLKLDKKKRWEAYWQSASSTKNSGSQLSQADAQHETPSSAQPAAPLVDRQALDAHAWVISITTALPVQVFAGRDVKENAPFLPVGVTRAVLGFILEGSPSEDMVQWCRRL